MPIEKLFKENRKMNIMVMGSGGLTSGLYLIENQEKYNYQVVALMTNKSSSKAFQYSEQFNIPVIYTNLKDFMEEWGWKEIYEKATPEYGEYKKRMRTDFDAYNAEHIQKEFIDRYNKSIDLVVMSGWMLAVYQPLLDMFHNRILNVHPADLRIIDSNGKRKYIGDDAVYDAIKVGEKETRSTIHIATENVDEGPIIVISPTLPVELAHANYTDKEIREYVDGNKDKGIIGHQERQKYACDNPAYLKAVELISQGRVSIDEKINAYINDILMPNGFIMD